MRSYKNITCVVSVLLVLLTQFAHADELSLAEPDFVGNIIAIQSSEGLQLEKQRAANHSRAGLFKASGSNIVQKATSPVRLEGGDKLQFIVRASSNDVDPAQVINIFALTSDPKKDYRYIETSSRGAFSSDSMAIEFLPFVGKRYGESSYLLTISQPVAAGEYAMTLDGSRDVFNLFGVD